MLWNDVVYFDGESTYEENAMGDITEIPGEPRMAYASQMSIRQSEFYLAQANGLRPELAFEVRSIEYNGESHLTFEEKRYSIIRTFDKIENTELICEGVK